MPDFNYTVDGTSIPATYGAIMNNSSGVNTVGTCYIYTSISDLSNVYVPRVETYNDTDDYFIVMPGYKLIVYQHTNYSGTSYTIDNTPGYTLLFKKSVGANTMSSCYLYFRGTLLSEIT